VASAFCVLATPRTGSTHLCSLLGSHPEICCHQELLHPAQIQAMPGAPVAEDREARARDPIRWLNAAMMASAEHDPRWRAIGFKLHLLQCPSVLEHILFQPGFAILLLDRADRLAQYASSKIAEQTGLFSCTDKEPVRAMAARFEAAEFEAFARRHEDLYRMVRLVTRGRADVLELDYDQIFVPATHRSALEFLGVDPAVTLTAPERKQKPSDVLARFVNPDDVVAALRQTRWSRFLPEDVAR
jgi:LPS sulfotransferase NodH